MLRRKEAQARVTLLLTLLRSLMHRSTNKAEVIYKFLKEKEANKESYTFSSKTNRFEDTPKKEVEAAKKIEKKLINELNSNFARPSFVKETVGKVSPPPKVNLIPKEPAFNSHSPRFQYKFKSDELNPGPGYYELAKVIPSTAKNCSNVFKSESRDAKSLFTMIQKQSTNSPSPANYSNPQTWIKKTFNATLPFKKKV